MKPKVLVFLALALALTLPPVQAASAQPPAPMPPGDQPAAAEPGVFGRTRGAADQDAGAASAPEVALGQPGLNFRYVRTSGHTGQPYPVDTQHLNRPNGIYVDAAGSLYVVEEYGQRLLRYDSTGANTLSIGEPGQPWPDGQYLAYPKAVTLDNAGNIWAAIDHAVKQFDAAGGLLQIFPATDPWRAGNGDDRFSEPRGVAFDNGGRLFVSDSANQRIQVFSLATGSPVHVATIGQTGVAGNDNTHFDSPAQIAFDSSNRLYVADAGNARVQRCTPSGATTWTCTTFHGTGSAGSGAGELNIPFGVAVDNSLAVYIADSGNGRVKKCGAGGSCAVFATSLGWPADVAVDTAGQVYVSDLRNNTVRKFSNTGAALGIAAGVNNTPYVADLGYFNAPWGLGVTPDGGAVLTENLGMRLIKLDAAGQPQWSVGQAGVYGNDNAHFGDAETGLEGNVGVDSAGRLYVADTANDRIQVFNANGSFNRTFGQSGNGNNQFDCPSGVAISPLNDDIFVVDRCNQRVQVYSSSWSFKLTLGVTDQAGSDNRHFRSPWGVAVNLAGAAYIADSGNYRVQKCTIAGANYACALFAGVTGSFGSDFGRLYPLSVAVDSAGRVYAADEGNSRVQVFDAAGAYLTTIGGAWGVGNAQLRNVSGVAVDRNGNLFAADRGNQRVQKFTSGVPTWTQTNINGFGSSANDAVLSLTPFGAQLYAGVNNGAGAQLWRQRLNGNWSAVTTDGFGDATNGGIDDLQEFNGQLYAGTWNWNGDANRSDGGQVWRSSDGAAWARVITAGFGDPTNGEVFRFAVFDNQIYASTWNWICDDPNCDTGHSNGGEIWRSSTGNAGDWARVVSGGFDDRNNMVAGSFETYNGYLYAGTFNEITGGEIWRSNDGTAWNKVNADGFGSAVNWAVSALAAFNGRLYASLRDRGQVWRCQICNGTDWQRVFPFGSGNSNTNKASALEVLGDQLFLVIGNYSTGMEVWRTQDGQQWTQIGFGGFGDSNNRSPWWDNSVVATGAGLLIGTWNKANGGEVWSYQPRQMYLPVIAHNE